MAVGGFLKSIAHKPLEQTPHDAEQMVVAASRDAVSRDEELRDHRRSDAIEALNLALHEEAIQEAQRLLLVEELAPERALRGEEVADARGEHPCPRSGGALHRSTSSPSPRATRRRASTATLA
jgi:hypothetical protein